MRLVVQGMTNPEISVQLNIAPSTVKTYLIRASQKLGARNRTDAAVRFVAQIYDVGWNAPRSPLLDAK